MLYDLFLFEKTNNLLLYFIYNLEKVTIYNRQENIHYEIYKLKHFIENVDRVLHTG